MKGSGEKETEKGTHNMARAQDVVAPRGQKVKWRPYNRGQRGGGGSMASKVRRFKLRRPLAMFWGSRGSGALACHVRKSLS